MTERGEEAARPTHRQAKSYTLTLFIPIRLSPSTRFNACSLYISAAHPLWYGKGAAFRPRRRSTLGFAAHLLSRPSSSLEGTAATRGASRVESPYSDIVVAFVDGTLFRSEGGERMTGSTNCIWEAGSLIAGRWVTVTRCRYLMVTGYGNSW